MEKHTIVWRGITVEITFNPKEFGMADHIELRGADKTPLPVTETGYRSNFLSRGHVAAHRGAVEFVTAWLDYEAGRLNWTGAQLSLF
jgi:hypothetical protein